METKINNYEKVLQTCCSDDAGIRIWMEAPFTIGEFTYATDSYMMLRVPNSFLSMEYKSVRDLSNLAIPQMFDTTPAALYYFSPKKLQQLLGSLPQVPEIKEANDVCGECDGDGEMECEHCGSMVECDNCKGTGYLYEPTGRMVTKNTNVKIGEIVF